MLHSLSSRNFRLYLAGQGLSLIGTWMQQVAISWLVYRLTHSSLLLGAVAFTAQIPTLFIGPFAGVWADRVNRRRLVIATQALLMLQAAVMAVLSASGDVRIWQIVVLGFLFGVVSSVDIPARQSFLVEMVEQKELLPNAIAINASLVNATRLIGPTVAGIVIAMTGEAACFAINALSFLAVIAALLAMKIPAARRPAGPHHILRGLKEGFAYAFGSKPIAAVLLLMALVCLLGAPYSVLMPIIAAGIFEGGPRTLGFLTAASGTGAFLGAVYLAIRRSAGSSPRLIGASAALFGLGLIAFSFSRHFALSIVLLCVCGFGIMVMMAAANTLIQTVADDTMRGRVVSYYVMSFLGIGPIGSLLAGAAAGHIGAPATIRIGGAFCVAGAFYFSKKMNKEIGHAQRSEIN